MGKNPSRDASIRVGGHEGVLTTLVIAGVLSGSSVMSASTVSEAAYAPLKLYNGKWSVSSSDNKTVAVENHCARTGLFYACEQVVNGKSEALVVFLPQGAADAGQVYRTQALRANASKPGPWYTLIIRGDEWIYVGEGERMHDRTVNHFDGPDHIHFDVQTSTDGKAWTSSTSGDERRVQ